MQQLNKGSRRSGGRWHKSGAERGVSPIIATILLVAITVVLAAVLYVLVSGLTRTGASTPYELGMSETSTTGSGTTYNIILALSPTSGLTTGAFGLKVASSGGITMATVAVSPAGCKAGAAPTTCTGTAGGWYGILVASNGTVVATYSGASATWGNYFAGVTTITLNGGFSLWLITQSSIAGAGNVISAFGTGTSSVSGSANL
jgi:flagellin-like protein